MRHCEETSMRSLLATIALVAAFGAGSVQARDTELRLPIADALADAEIKSKIPNDVAFYFGSERTPAITKTFGEYVTNKKTNSVGRPDAVVCRWAMLSALIQLRDRAKQLGANGVVNVVSYYKKDTQSSPTHYVCHAGNVVAGVALKGSFVTLGPGGPPPQNRR
jgi:hypothetical protein